MNIILKFKSDFNALVYTNHIKEKIYKDSFKEFFLSIENEENFIVDVEPIEKNNSILLPYKIFFNFKNNKLEILSNNIDVLNYENNYYIILKKLELTKNMQILYSDNNFSVFNTYCTNISTKNETISLPSFFKLIEIKKSNLNNILLFENENKKYSVVLFQDSIIFKDYYDEIKFDRKIQIFSKIKDIAKHGIIFEIINKEITKKIVYQQNKPKITKSTKCIPIAFLQALKIKNYKLCNFYLSENLKEKVSQEKLEEYFQNFTKVELYNNSYLLFYENSTCKKFDFIVENYKITKIDCN